MATLQQAIDNLVTATSTANDVINQAKAVNTNATNHKTDPAAHSELFAKPAPDVALSGGKTAKGQGQVGTCTRTASVTNADQYTTDGRYFIFNIDAVSNWPAEGSGGILTVDSYSTYVMQEMRLLNGRAYRRTKSTAGDWLPWKPVITGDMANAGNGYAAVNANGRVVLDAGNGDEVNVGNTAVARLAVNGTGNDATFTVVRRSEDNVGSGVNIAKARGTAKNSIDAVQKNDSIGTISFVAADGVDLNHYAARIFAYVDGTPTAGSVPGRMIFATTKEGEEGSVSRWQIDNVGNYKPVSGNTYDIGSSIFTVRNIYSANAVTVGSDRRLKTDIEDTPLGLDFINALRPVAYRLIVGDQIVAKEQETDEKGEPLFIDVQDGTEQVRVGTDERGEPIFEERPVMRREPKLREAVTTRPGARTHYGLIAQEVREALDSVTPGVDFAGWVLENKDDPDSQQALRYEQFIAPLIKAVQEQQVQIEALRAEVTALKAGV